MILLEPMHAIKIQSLLLKQIIEVLFTTNKCAKLIFSMRARVFLPMQIQAFHVEISACVCK